MNGWNASHSSNSWHCSLTAKSKSSTSVGDVPVGVLQADQQVALVCRRGDEAVEVERVIGGEVEAGVVRVTVDVVGLDTVAASRRRARSRRPSITSRTVSLRISSQRSSSKPSRGSPRSDSAYPGSVGPPRLVRASREVADHDATVSARRSSIDIGRGLEQVDVVHVGVDGGVELALELPVPRGRHRQRRSLGNRADVVSRGDLDLCGHLLIAGFLTAVVTAVVTVVVATARSHHEAGSREYSDRTAQGSTASGRVMRSVFHASATEGRVPAGVFDQVRAPPSGCTAGDRAATSA